MKRVERKNPKRNFLAFADAAKDSEEAEERRVTCFMRRNIVPRRTGSRVEYLASAAKHVRIISASNGHP